MLPVKLTLAMSGWTVRWVPTLNGAVSSPEMVLNTPGGNTSFRISPMRSEVIGVMGLGLRTKELPQVIAGAHFCTAQKIGKFHLCAVGERPAAARRGRWARTG